MRVRIGLGVARDAIRAVALRGGRIVWAAEAEVPSEGEDALASTIAALLADAPGHRWPRTIVAAAVGPHASQVRLVAGLPEVLDAETLAAVVREGAAAFFLKNGAPLVTTGVRPVAPGVAWAAALDESCLAAIRDACRMRRWRLDLVAPTAVVLPLALEGESHSWVDGPVLVELTWRDGRLESARTRVAALSQQPAAPQARPVAALGDRAARYADAYGAALLDRGEALAVDPLAQSAGPLGDLRRRLRAPAIVTLAAAALMLVSPLAAVWVGRRAERRAAEVRPQQWDAIVTATEQLDRVTQVLDDVRRFAESRRTAAILLGRVTEAFPDGSALASFALNDDQAQVMVLTSQPQAVVAALERLPDVASAETLGSAIRQVVADRPFDRVTIRLRLTPLDEQVPESRGAP